MSNYDFSSNEQASPGQAGFGRPARRPYQFSPQPEAQIPGAGQQGPAGERPVNQNGQSWAYSQNSYGNQPNYQGGRQQPYAGYSNQQPQAPGTFAAPPRKPVRRRRSRGCLITTLVVLILLCILVSFTVVTGQKVLAFGSAISTQSPLSTQTGYMNTSDRVNILLVGYGGAGHDGAYLTDSMMIMSLIPSSHHTTLISVPRDLWVQYPPNSGNYGKLNSIYNQASNANAKPVAGGDALAQKISLVTGLDVKYWMTINFAGFRDFINAIGGVDVNVQHAFTAKYPKNDDPAINASWITVHFNKGLQHMDGQRAIIFARARYVLDDPAEGSDFARSARQQLIMQAALVKLKQSSTWPSLYNALGALSHTLYSNLSLADLAQFALKMDLTAAHRVGLSNQNVLADSTSSDGQYILQPRDNNWQGIVDYVKKQLYT